MVKAARPSPPERRGPGAAGTFDLGVEASGLAVGGWTFNEGGVQSIDRAG